MRQFQGEAAGARLAAEESGEGPLVVALHAGVADRRSWRSMAAALPGYRFVAYDRRGFGETTYEPETYSELDDLAIIMATASEGEPAVLIGNSMGGAVAMDYALHAPGKVRALVLIAPAVSGGPRVEEPPSVMALYAAIGDAEKAGDLDAMNAVEARLWLDGSEAPEGRVSGEVRDLFLDMNGVALRSPPAGEEQDGPDAWDRLDQVAVPVLVMAGDLEAAVMVDVWRTLAERLPRGEFALLEGVAHLPQMERPEQVAGLVREFLARHDII